MFPASIPTADRTRLTAAYAKQVREVINPAHVRMRDFLANEYLAKARDTVGLSALPGGAALYAQRIEDSTTLPLEPEAVHQLGLSGIVTTVRGRNGGLRLNVAPAVINIGAVVRQTETDFYMAECFDRNSNTCSYSSGCELKGVLGRATSAYLAVLDGVSLADLIAVDPEKNPRQSRAKTSRFVDKD